MRILLLILLIIIFLPLLIGLAVRLYIMFHINRSSGLLGILRALLKHAATNHTDHLQQNSQNQPTGSSKVSRPINKDTSKMVKCANCQLYIPENEAFAVKGTFYCCHAHAETHNKSEK